MRLNRSGLLRAPTERRQSGFTLVELLVVITIILALTAITIVSVNFSIGADKVRAGARQIQSLLAGARDRAIYSKEVRGIRLIRDPNDSHAANAIQYVGAPTKFSIGTVSVTPPASGGDGTIVTGINTYFSTFKTRGIIGVGSRIQIPKSTGRWYIIAGYVPGTETIILSQKYSEFYSTANFTNLTYQLELQPQPLPDSPPVQLPKGVVIDLDGSYVPSSWRPSGSIGAYSNQMDILFSSKGLPTGNVTNLGMLHLHIADVGDVTRWNSTQPGVGIDGRNGNAYVCTAATNIPIVPADIPGGPVVVTRDRILVTMSTRTGNVLVAPVNVNNSATQPVVSPFTIDSARIADDPYFYAESGEVAGK